MQGLEIKHQNQLLHLVRSLLPNPVSKFKVKTKYLGGGDAYKYREAVLTAKNFPGIQFICAFGTMLVKGKRYPITDINLSFDKSQTEAVNFVKSFAENLLAGKSQFVLVEPDLTMRVAMLRREYHVQNLKAYDKNSANTAVCTMLPWQVYEINRVWRQILEHPEKRGRLRQLRIKIRRLRSVLSLLEPMLQPEELEAWKQRMRISFNLLAVIREVEVALEFCEKIARSEGCQEDMQLLTKILLEKKSALTETIVRPLKLNALTKNLTEFLLWVYTMELKAQNLSMEEFFKQRFKKWSKKLEEIGQKHANSKDVEKLHKIRIKIKRFRYALHAAPEIKKSNQLLKNLKYLQDSLGFIHDNLVNQGAIDKFIADCEVSEALQKEVDIFKTWDQAKAESILETFPEEWETLLALLHTWREEALDLPKANKEKAVADS